MAGIEQHLANLDKRIRRLEKIVERQLELARPDSATRPSASRESPGQRAMPPEAITPAQALPAGLRGAASGAPAAAGRGETPRAVGVTQILGWSGAAALVLAAAYFIRLAVDAGWLTPARQVGVAALCGIGLMWVGFVLRKADRRYASLLPAAGIVILFITVFGAHLYYGFISAPLASGFVAAICILTLWLGRVFETEFYVLFAVIGAYLTPFLLPLWHANLIDLLIYYMGYPLSSSTYHI